MDKKRIDRFFRVLSQDTRNISRSKIKIILTGAAAGNLLGGNRPSIDIDFAIGCNKKYFKDVEDAIKKVSQITGIAVNFSEDIDRWSQITLLDYKKHTVRYKTFRNVEVTILLPLYWSIGKITRYLDPDIDDLVKVFKKNRILPMKLAQLWGKAVLKSPRSSACFAFRMHAEHFFKTYGRSIWGRDFLRDKYIEVFQKTAGIKR